VPRSGTAAAAVAGGDAQLQLLLPADLQPITFSLLWEQQMDAGEAACSGGTEMCSMRVSTFPFMLWGFNPGCAPATALAGIASQPLEGHLAADGDGDLLLCLLSKAAQRLIALRLPPPAAAVAAPAAAGRRVEVAFTLPALAAAAVTATLRCGDERQDGGAAPPPRDLLLLQPDGRLALHAGRRLLCTVGLPSGDGAAAAAYAQLLRSDGRAPGAEPAAGADLSQAGELSASRRPPSAAEVLSSASDGAELDAMLVSPGRIQSPARLSHAHSEEAAGGAPLPDVGVLGEALQAAPPIVGLQASVVVLGGGGGGGWVLCVFLGGERGVWSVCVCVEGGGPCGA
jgi:hypothetical protein